MVGWVRLVAMAISSVKLRVVPNMPVSMAEKRKRWGQQGSGEEIDRVYDGNAPIGYRCQG